jgi:glucokinase
MTVVLAGDVGGTKANLGIFTNEKGPHAPIVGDTLRSTDYPSLADLIKDFLVKVDTKVDRASFGVAGPVVSGKAYMTNLQWEIEEAKLAAELKLSNVTLLNDLQAIAHAVPYLEPDDLHTLNEGKPIPQGAIAVIAPGTGLGEAFLTWDGRRYRAHPSEGGHADFAPTGPLEIEMLSRLQREFGHVSCERVCSGRGLPNVYAFLKDTGKGEEPSWLTERLGSVDDPTPVIVEVALDRTKECQLCELTLQTFVSILGAEAGNLAMKVLATGGVYLGGGIAPRILPALDGTLFMDAFRSKGRLSDLLADVPVHVILNPKVALIGAACQGLEC